MDENLLKVGKYDNKFNEILGIEIAEVEIYRSKDPKGYTPKFLREELGL